MIRGTISRFCLLWMGGQTVDLGKADAINTLIEKFLYEVRMPLLILKSQHSTPTNKFCAARTLAGRGFASHLSLAGPCP